MDYIQYADYTVHDSFQDFLNHYPDARFIAMEANVAAKSYYDFHYNKDDILIVGSEHYGFLPDDLKKIPHTVKIPMVAGRRSINMAISAAIILSEAMRQTNAFPIDATTSIRI